MYGFSAIDCRIAGCVIALMLTLGCILFGYLEDKIGTKNNLLLSWGGLALSSLYFYESLSSDMSAAMLYVNYGIFGLFCGAITTTPIVGIRAFPPAIRYSGLSFSYNLAYAIFSAITPTLTLSLLNPNFILGEYAYLGAGVYIAFVALIAAVLGFSKLAQQGWRA